MRKGCDWGSGEQSRDYTEERQGQKPIPKWGLFREEKYLCSSHGLSWGKSSFFLLGYFQMYDQILQTKGSQTCLPTNITWFLIIQLLGSYLGPINQNLFFKSSLDGSTDPSGLGSTVLVSHCHIFTT